MPEKQVKPKLTQTQIELETRDKRRLETFIDGVFAIAITLLGLKFVVPLVQHSNQALIASLVGFVPKFIGISWHSLRWASCLITIGGSFRTLSMPTR
ncbi:MAG: TMEM175 family protein [Halobacteriota archaeon]